MKLERFESAKGPDYSKLDFQQQQDELHANILVAQRACRKAGVPIVILVSGVEAAGKSAVVNRLSKWLDMRNVRTISYWGESDDERNRPRDWRFWRDLPGKGEISILFGSWYTHPIVKAATGMEKKKKIDAYLEEECRHINRFERLLADDGVVFVKMWFHISKKEQAKRIKAKKTAGYPITPYEKTLSKSYDDFALISDRVLTLTESNIGHWHVIDSRNKRSRDLRAGRILLEHMNHALTTDATEEVDTSGFNYAEQRLFHINLDKQLSERQYKKQLDKYQARLADLHWAAREQNRSTVMVFEGWDAAGKGGAIRRLTGAMDARLYRVIPVAAPTDEEKAHHYLWRFWRQLPQDGYFTIYDRSWYGRVLVERVEGFARDDEWQRAYDEINDFECQLTNHGIIMAKFWLHISDEEQLRRFKEREKIEHKKHKLTEEDWRNREKWSAYEQAVDDMLARTDKRHSPWYVIPANDKLYARIEVIKAVCKRLERALD
jgi:polyphosphate:AMP phosphotransferase